MRCELIDVDHRSTCGIASQIVEQPFFWPSKGARVLDSSFGEEPEHINTIFIEHGGISKSGRVLDQQCLADRLPGEEESSFSSLAQALIDALNTSALPNAEINLVLSNRKTAYGLTRAEQANPPIPTAYFALQPFLNRNPGKKREDYDVEVAKMILRANPDIVVLAGWMHILSEAFLDLLTGKKKMEGDIEQVSAATRANIPVINLHPALPGQFDGANAIERAYEAYRKGEVTKSGAMVHRVIKDVDKGEPIVVEEIAFVEGESMEDYQTRIHTVEHKIIVQAVKSVLDEI